MATSEPVVLHHGREDGGNAGDEVRPSASTACWAARDSALVAKAPQEILGQCLNVGRGATFGETFDDGSKVFDGGLEQHRKIVRSKFVLRFDFGVRSKRPDQVDQNIERSGSNPRCPRRQDLPEVRDSIQHDGEIATAVVVTDGEQKAMVRVGRRAVRFGECESCQRRGNFARSRVSRSLALRQFHLIDSFEHRASTRLPNVPPLSSGRSRKRGGIRWRRARPW